MNDSGQKTTKDVKESQAVANATWRGGDPMTEKQEKWFSWKRIPLPEGMTKFRAVVVRDLIESGVSPQFALSMPKRQALTVRDKYKQHQGGAQ